MNILTAYYRVAADILKEHLPCIPKLKLTNAKSYYGKIYIKSGQFDSIALSKWNLDVNPYFIEDEDIEEIIDTICHEFAYMYFWEHGEDHTETTNAFVSYVKCELKIRTLEEKLINMDRAV